MKLFQSTSWLSIFSVAILLLFVGLFTLISFHTKSITNSLKMNANLEVEFEKNVTDADIKLISDRISTMEEYIPSSLVIYDEQDALDIMKDELPKDWASENINPFNKALIFNIKAKYYYFEKLEDIKKEIKNIPGVASIYYQNTGFDIIESNISRLSTYLFLLAVLFTLLTIVLLHNSFHLLLMNDQKKIRTMLLVGAKREFVLLPYLKKSFSIGLTSYILFSIIMFLILLFINNSLDIFTDILVPQYVILVLVIVLIIALSLPMISTYMIVNLYLKKYSNIYR